MGWGIYNGSVDFEKGIYIHAPASGSRCFWVYSSSQCVKGSCRKSVLACMLKISMHQQRVN
jgi:hypothetical protein